MNIFSYMAATTCISIFLVEAMSIKSEFLIILYILEKKIIGASNWFYDLSSSKMSVVRIARPHISSFSLFSHISISAH